MCEKTNFKYCPSKIDKCMINTILILKSMCLKSGMSVCSCCCGHGIYPKTIIIQLINGTHLELLTGKIIPRKKRFYKKDKKGFYYIPEISAPYNYTIYQ